MSTSSLKTFAANCTNTSGLPGVGGAGGSPGSVGNNGTDGQCGTSEAGSGGGGGGGGGGVGAGGGNGAGGGILLKSTSGSISIIGTIDARGGSDQTTNGGTVKAFSATDCAALSNVLAGRTYQSSAGMGANGNCIPTPPILLYPVSSSNGNSVFTTFKLRSSDAEGDSLNYWIDVCADNICSSIIRNICQLNTGTSVPGTCAPSQTGWAGQDAQSGTTYASSPTLTTSTIATLNYQPPLLSANTQYWWRGYAIDPGGSNTWSSSSTINTFTTAPTETHIQGNVRLQGNVNL